MKFGKMKRVLAVVCAATMLMSATLMVCAEEQGNTNPGNTGTTQTPSDEDENEPGAETETETVTVTVTKTVTSNSLPSVSVPEPTYDEKMAVKANATMSVAGIETKTSVNGVYAAEKVRGTVVTTPAADVKAALGLTGTQSPTIFVYDVNAKKSVNAMASINAAADALGTDVVACLHIELGARENGKWVELSDGSIALKTGLPKSADKSLTYYVICVQEGGVITVLEDLDTDPNTVTFDVNAGVGAYAIVAM